MTDEDREALQAYFKELKRKKLAKIYDPYESPDYEEQLILEEQLGDLLEAPDLPARREVSREVPAAVKNWKPGQSASNDKVD